MTRTARHISVLVACAAALAGCSTPGNDPSSQADPSSPSASASPGPGEDPAEPGDTEPAAPDSAGPDETTGSPAPSKTPSDPVEVLPPSPSASGLPGLSPAPKPGKPLVSRPLPADASAEGALVRGYPSGVLPAAPDSTVESSSVAADGRRLQVALTARTDRSPGAVLLFYRQTLTALGFTEDHVSAAAGARAAGFRRGQNSVTVTVTRDGDGSSYTLFSTLYAG